MTSIPPIVIPQVMRDVSELKIAELNRAKALFKHRYALQGSDNAVVTQGGDADVFNRLNNLLERIKELDPYLERDEDLPMLTRLVEQAKNDRSISAAKLTRLESELKEKVEKHANRLEVSSLHVELLKEVLDTERNENDDVVERKMGNIALEDEFEMVEDELESVFERFEKNTFANKDVDEERIEKYLESLFDKEAAQDQLKEIRSAISDYGDEVLQSCEEVDDELVIWCIEDLLNNDLLSDEKKKALQTYLHSPLAIKELKSTLNMKSVRHWNFHDVEKGLPVSARQNAEGKYNIVIDEDIIDTLFLHSLAVGWSSKLKDVLKEAVSYKGVWPGNNLLSIEELEEREYWLQATRYKPYGCGAAMPPPPPPPMGPPGTPGVVNVYPTPPPHSQRRRAGGPPPPMPMPMHVPPPPAPQVYPPRPGKITQKKKAPMGKYVRRNALPMPGTPNLNDERYRNYTRSFFLARLPMQVGCAPEVVDEKKTQALLLKTLATEAKLRLALDGTVGSVTAKFEAFAEALPHQTILTVLKFIGMPKQWLDVFTRFLKAPLNMGPVVRGTDDQILTRTCGVPVNHGFEVFFTEAVLFFLDLAVHQKTNAYMYRLRNKCYFVGKQEQVAPVTEAAQDFATAMGVDITTKNLHDEPIGFVNLHANADVVNLTLDFTAITAYANLVKKQLASCSTTISWIRVWNNTIGTYAAHLFGPLANVMGKSHLDTVTQAYNHMYSIIFPPLSNPTTHITHLLTTHLKYPTTNPPISLEALLHLPSAYGGLGLKTPYTTLTLAHNLPPSPTSHLESFKTQEEKYYLRAKARFERMTPQAQQEKLSNLFNNDTTRQTASLGPTTDPSLFPSLSHIARHRERSCYPYLPYPSFPEPSTPIPIPDLIDAYTQLLCEPRDDIVASDRVHDEVARLAGRGGGSEGRTKRFWQLSGEERWAIVMYADECFEGCGGLEVWLGESVPREVFGVVRGEDREGEGEGSEYFSSED
ncbi:hypothetical protein CC80DRAFT_535009 [Byssothecium circinans]|uniref:Uncharacterized protein n=1 Tax=Byssothecium circinans TaxID=147558 RepID=A0A6A5U7E2_9PLEO|nr:hypothetical protein CC80DRAFT_535009 [Byssothecium circinans]